MASKNESTKLKEQDQKVKRAKQILKGRTCYGYNEEGSYAQGFKRLC